MIIPSVALVTPFQFRNLIDFLTGPPLVKIPGALPRAGHLDRLPHFGGDLRGDLCRRAAGVRGQRARPEHPGSPHAYIDRVNGLGAAYFARMRTADLLARFIATWRARQTLARTVAYSLYYIILLSVTFVSLLIMSWQLTMILLIIVPTFIVISRAMGPKIQRAHRGRQERIAQINATFRR